jgi:hypothetical protein
MALPMVPPAASAPRASVVGRGINGLLHAALLRCQGWQVDVYGGTEEADGASHKNINMRHLSATETTAKPIANTQLHALNNRLVVRFNQASMELFRQFLADNPRFQRFVSEGLVRAFPEGVAYADRDARIQHEFAREAWPGGRPATGSRELPAPEFSQRFGAAGVGKAVEVPGYDLAFRDFMAELADALESGGVRFVRERLTRGQIHDLAAADNPVITAMGVADEGIIPIVWWFFRMPAAAGEGGGFRGLKLHYPLPVGVMNCRCDGGSILVSGGQVPHDASPEQAQAIKTAVMQAVARHFPVSFAQAQTNGSLEVVACARPGVLDGMSRIEQTGPYQTMVGGTYAGGMTQGMGLAAMTAETLVQRSRS